jgi:hypothetical protein
MIMSPEKISIAPPARTLKRSGRTFERRRYSILCVLSVLSVKQKKRIRSGLISGNKRSFKIEKYHSSEKISQILIFHEVFHDNNKPANPTSMPFIPPASIFQVFTVYFSYFKYCDSG